MRRSSLRLVIFSVLACWAVGFVILVLYGRSQEWTEDKVRRDGVFLAYELLEATQPTNRTRRLSELQAHVSADLAIISLDELERPIGRQGTPGEAIPQRSSMRQAWYFIVFRMGVAPWPRGLSICLHGVVPIGLLL